MQKISLSKTIGIILSLSILIYIFQPIKTYACATGALDIITLNNADFEEVNNALVAQGEISRRARATNRLVFPYDYRQAGQTWSNDIMQTAGHTIGSQGCCLTSFTNIQRFYGGTLNPGEVNSRLGNSACPFNYASAANTFGYSIVNQQYGSVTDSYAISFIVGSIDSVRPVLVGMEYSGGTHFVTAYGYSGDYIYIRDPAGRYTFLNDYFDAGYSVHRLYVYAD